LVHGLGHHSVGENDTASLLLSTEVLGIVLVGASYLMEDLSDGAGEAAALKRIFSHAGMLLFMGSWGADILGTFKGAEPFEPDGRPPEGSRLGLAYRYTHDPLSDLRHHLVARLQLNTRYFSLRPEVDLESGMRNRRFDLDIGAHLLSSERLRSNFSLGARLRWEETPEYDLGARGAQGDLRWKLDLGHLIRSMKNFFVFSRIGYGYMDYQFGESVGLLADGDFMDSYLLLESGVQVNSSRDTQLTLLFSQDPYLEIAPFSSGTGIIQAGLLHRYQDDLDIEFEWSVGEGWAIYLGLGYGL